MQQQQDLIEFPVISSSDDERENSDIQDIKYPKDTSCSSISSSEREENWDLSANPATKKGCVEEGPGGRKMRWCVSNGPIRGPPILESFPACVIHIAVASSSTQRHGVAQDSVHDDHSLRTPTLTYLVQSNTEPRAHQFSSNRSLYLFLGFYSVSLCVSHKSIPFMPPSRLNVLNPGPTDGRLQNVLHPQLVKLGLRLLPSTSTHLISRPDPKRPSCSFLQMVLRMVLLSCSPPNQL
jgi:hypothetical protein